PRETLARSGSVTQAQLAPTLRARTRRAGLVLGGVLAAVVASVVLYARRAPALTDKDSIVLAEFVNTTGEEVFDDTLRQALAVQLDQSPFLNVLPERRVRRALGLMARSGDERLTGAVAREVCEREGAKALLTGSIAPAGSGYVLAVETTSCRTGKTLAREQR